MKASLGHAYAKANKKDESRRIVAELNELAHQRYVSSYERAAISVALGDETQAFESLERAYEEHSFHLVYLKVWPQFDGIRSDPRFQNLVNRLGLSSISSQVSAV